MIKEAGFFQWIAFSRAAERRVPVSSTGRLDLLPAMKIVLRYLEKFDRFVYNQV